MCLEHVSISPIISAVGMTSLLTFAGDMSVAGLAEMSSKTITTPINSQPSEEKKQSAPVSHKGEEEENHKERNQDPSMDLSDRMTSKDETGYLSDLLDKETPCFKIHSIKIVGEYADTFSGALDAINAKEKNIRVNPLHHCIGAKAINVMMKKVQNKIISAGYITTRIVAQPQDLNTLVGKLLNIIQIKLLNKTKPKLMNG